MTPSRKHTTHTHLLTAAVFILQAFITAHAAPLPDLPAEPKAAWELELAGADLGDILQKNNLTANRSAMLEGAMEVFESDIFFDSPVLQVADLDERGTPLLQIDMSSWSSEGQGALVVDFRAARDTGSALSGQFILASGTAAGGSELLSVSILGKDVIIKEGNVRLGSEGREGSMQPLGREGSSQPLRLTISWYTDSDGSQKADVVVEAANGSRATSSALPLENSGQWPEQLQIRAGKLVDADGRGLLISRIQGFSEPLSHDGR
jgi:hypothetical protein